MGLVEQMKFTGARGRALVALILPRFLKPAYILMLILWPLEVPIEVPLLKSSRGTSNHSGNGAVSSFVSISFVLIPLGRETIIARRFSSASKEDLCPQ